MKLNEKIYACRRKCGLSQEALAEQIGVSRQSVSKWETGEASPEISKLPLLAQTFHVSTDWLLSEEDMPSDEPAESFPAAEPLPAQTSATYSAWPSWVDELPGFLGRCIKRYGWLYGLRIALGGALFTAFGILMLLVVSSFTASTGFDDLWSSSPLGGSSFSSDPWLTSNAVTWYDEAGNVTSTPFTVSVSTPKPSDPMRMIAVFVIIVGVVTMVIGGVIAAALKKYGNDHPSH